MFEMDGELQVLVSDPPYSFILALRRRIYASPTPSIGSKHSLDVTGTIALSVRQLSATSPHAFPEVAERLSG